MSLLWLSALACTGKPKGADGADREADDEIVEIVETVARATYYVVNQTEGTVVFEAVHLGGEGSLNVEIPAGESVEVDRVAEGTGGHTMPSNFYTSHTVRLDGVQIGRTLGDDDWVDCESGQLPSGASPAGAPSCLVVKAADF